MNSQVAPKIVHAGFMRKAASGKKTSNIQTRYFVVYKNGTMEYFAPPRQHNQTNNCSDPATTVALPSNRRGIVNLREYDVSDISSVNTSKHSEFTISLTPGSAQSNNASYSSASSSFSSTSSSTTTNTTVNYLTKPLNFFYSKQEDAEAWLAVFRGAIWVPRGLGLFGIALTAFEQFVREEDEFLPRQLIRLIRLIESDLISTVGLFRLSGNKRKIRELSERIDRNQLIVPERYTYKGEEGGGDDACGIPRHTDSREEVAVEDFVDPLTACDLLKLYLRRMPEPLIPFCKYEAVKSIGFALSFNENVEHIRTHIFLAPPQQQTTQQEVDSVAQQHAHANTHTHTQPQPAGGGEDDSFPLIHRRLLRRVCVCMQRVAAHSSANQMGVRNLALVMAPNVIRDRDYDPNVECDATALIVNTMEQLIDKAPHLLLPLHELYTPAQAAHTQAFAQTPPPPPRSSPALSMRKSEQSPTVLSKVLPPPIRSSSPKFAGVSDNPHSSTHSTPSFCISDEFKHAISVAVNQKKSKRLALYHSLNSDSLDFEQQDKEQELEQQTRKTERGDGE